MATMAVRWLQGSFQFFRGQFQRPQLKFLMLEMFLEISMLWLNERFQGENIRYPHQEQVLSSTLSFSSDRR